MKLTVAAMPEGDIDDPYHGVIPTPCVWEGPMAPF